MRERERPERPHRGSPQQCGGARLLGITKHHQKFRCQGCERNHLTSLTESAVWDSAVLPSFALKRGGRNAQLLVSAATKNPTRKAMDSWSLTFLRPIISRRGKSDHKLDKLVLQHLLPRNGNTSPMITKKPPQRRNPPRGLPADNRTNDTGTVTHCILAQATAPQRSAGSSTRFSPRAVKTPPPRTHTLLHSPGYCAPIPTDNPTKSPTF